MAVLAGCGSASLSTTQLRHRATAACSSASRRTDRIITPTSSVGAPTFLARGIAALEPELKRLRSLHAPDDLADVYKTSVSAFSRQLDELRTALRRLRAGGDPVITIKTLQARLAPLESTSNGGWRALEIPACLSQ